MSPYELLGPDEPPSYRIARSGGRSPFVITCDHAGRLLPRKLGNLGLSERELLSHIAWDIGAAGLAEKLAHALDAFLILQTYSRLVIDVNRPLTAPDSIVTRSERSAVPGNVGLSAEQAEQRAQAVFWPYQRRIQAELEDRLARALPSILITLHSFTPVFMDQARAVQIGVLYGRDQRLGQALLARLRAEGDLCIGDNEPYAVSDDGDYTLLAHGEGRGIPHVELEIRQDLIADDAGQQKIARRLAPLLSDVTAQLFPT